MSGNGKWYKEKWGTNEEPVETPTQRPHCDNKYKLEDKIMSNFQCPHCGMTNIDCGREGYKTPKEIELEYKLKEKKMLRVNEFLGIVIPELIKYTMKTARENPEITYEQMEAELREHLFVSDTSPIRKFLVENTNINEAIQTHKD